VLKIKKTLIRIKNKIIRKSAQMIISNNTRDPGVDIVRARKEVKISMIIERIRGPQEGARIM
jgi:hypothetical protein